MNRTASLLVPCFVGALAALTATAIAAAPQQPSSAVGVVDIHQDKALAGNVTPGDGAGFPVTISQRGSYRLTSNLVVPNAVANGITITADDVTVDLNGFAIVGPGCSGKPVVCNGTGAGIVTQEDRTGITLRNGTVRGMPSGGVWLGNGGRVEDMQVLANGQGITIRRGAAANNVVQGNAGLGIWIYEVGSVVGNQITDNGDLGLFISPRGAWGQNTLYGNNAGGNGVQAIGGTAIAPNFCNWAVCP